MCVECERGVWQHGGRMFKVTLALAVVQYWAKHLYLPISSWCLLQLRQHSDNSRNSQMQGETATQLLSTGIHNYQFMI